MIKTMMNTLKQDKEKFKVPKGVQDIIPITAIYDDGIFKVGKDKYSKSFKFTDINYAVANKEDKESMFLDYSELLNSFDSGATTKITINNRRLNRLDFENTILIEEKDDNLNEYRKEYNKMLLDKATDSNAIIQDKYVTISINKKNIEDARNYFARVGTDLIAHFNRLGSRCIELETDERLRIAHDFFRTGEESSSHFDLKETRRKGHNFKDYICPDTMEFDKDYFKMGNRYGRVLFLRDYASYIKDTMVAELTDLNCNLQQLMSLVYENMMSLAYSNQIEGSFTTADKLTEVITGREDANFSSSNGKYKFFTCSNTPLKCDEYAFESSSILIAGNGDFNVKHYSGKFNAYQRTYVLTPAEEYYGLLYLSSLYRINSFKTSSAGSIVKFITKGDIENIPIFIPKDKKYLSYFNELVLTQEHILSENDELTNLRDWLLPMLMNGQATIEN